VLVLGCAGLDMERPSLMDKSARTDVKSWNRPYAIINDGRGLSYGHPPKPELTLSNHPIPPFDTKFDYSVPVMGQPSDHKIKPED
jgi:hypothetical protein